MNEFKRYEKNKKIIIKSSQILIGVLFILIWEILSRFNIINSFIFSSPSKIIRTIIDLYKSGILFNNIFITLLELFVSFILGSFLGFIIALLFYRFDTLKKIFDPYSNKLLIIKESRLFQIHLLNLFKKV